MTYAALGKLKKNSPEATLTAGIDDTTGTIPVDHLEYFHDEDGTLIVKGIVLGPDTATITETEEITITGASGTTGAGNLTGGTRGVNADGTVGAAKAWDSGTVIKVTYTTGIHNQIADNFAKIQTTAAMSVYVDAAATGAADGTSWTDAFTTIQAALDSLPTVIEHAVTIYVRKGTTDYAENLTLSQDLGKGTLTIRGEYYWSGQCAAASTPSATKFNLTATDGANIAAGDPLFIRDGSADYVYTTVKATVDKGSNVWEIETNSALPTGNIGTGDYYTICKTKIVASSGIGVSFTSVGYFSLIGLYIAPAAGAGVYSNSCPVTLITSCFISGSATFGVVTAGGGAGYLSIQNSYVSCAGTGTAVLSTTPGCNLRIGTVASNGCVITTAGNGRGVYTTHPGVSISLESSPIDVQAGTGVEIAAQSRCSLSNCTISPSGRTAATTGIKISYGAIVTKTTVTNNATTPESGSVGAFGLIV